MNEDADYLASHEETISAMKYQIQQLEELLRRARAEKTSLQAIVDKLDKTEDEVPIIPPMIVWQYNPTFGRMCKGRISDWAQVAERLSRKHGCYSTRAAAEAAKREQE